MSRSLLEVLRDVTLDPGEQAAFSADPAGYLAQFGYEDVPADDLAEAFSLVADTLPADVAQAVSPTTLTADPFGSAGSGLGDDGGQLPSEGLVGGPAFDADPAETAFGAVNHDFDDAGLDSGDAGTAGTADTADATTGDAEAGNEARSYGDDGADAFSDDFGHEASEASEASDDAAGFGFGEGSDQGGGGFGVDDAVAAGTDTGAGTDDGFAEDLDGDLGDGLGLAGVGVDASAVDASADFGAGEADVAYDADDSVGDDLAFTDTGAGDDIDIDDIGAF